MNRRDLLTTGLGLGLVTIARDAIADDKKAPTPTPAKPDPRTLLLDALAICIAKGLACAAHCQTELASGAKEFGHCNAAVNDLLEVTRATQWLVARQSPNAKKLADACAAVCKECSAACAEHKAHWVHSMHLECKACMEACDACAKACAAFG